MKLVISHLESKDLEDFTNLARTTFVESYKSVDSAYYIKKHLAKYITLENLRKEFNTRRNHFFIARIDEEPVGFCKLVGDENEDHPFLIKHRSIELERLYVLKKYQHLGVGHYLIKHCLDVAAASSYEIIWLGVSDKNKFALEVFKQCGFIYFDTHLFDFGGQQQLDIMMKRPVKYQEEDLFQQKKIKNWIQKFKKYLLYLSCRLK